MANKDTKIKRIKENKEQDYVAHHEHFSWKKTGELNRKDGSVTITLERDKKSPNYKKVKKLEKQYKKINSKFPLGGTIILAIGLLTLIPFFVIEDMTIKYSILSVALLITFIGVFFIGAFFIILMYRKSILEQVLNEADRLGGRARYTPEPTNLSKLNSKSEQIKKMVHTKK